MLIDFIHRKAKETEALPRQGKLHYTQITGTKKTVVKAE